MQLKLKWQQVAILQEGKIKKPYFWKKNQTNNISLQKEALTNKTFSMWIDGVRTIKVLLNREMVKSTVW